MKSIFVFGAPPINVVFVVDDVGNVPPAMSPEIFVPCCMA